MTADPLPIRVRLHNDGLMSWPLWIQGSIADDMSATPLSAELKEDLLAWTRFYREHTDDAWDDAANTARYNRLGRELAARVLMELGPGHRVLLDIQETSSEKHEWVEMRASA